MTTTGPTDRLTHPPARRYCGTAISAVWAGVDRSSALWPAVLLGLALAACKVVHIKPPGILSWAYISCYLGNVAIAIHADLIYALSVGLIGQAILLLARRHPRLQTAVWLSIISFFTISVLYAVISVQVFWFLRMPLTYALIYLAGDVKNMQSSVGAFMTPLLAMALVGLPLTYLAVVFAVSPFRLPPTRRFRIARASTLIVLLVFALLCHRAAQGRWSELHDNRRVAQSPHCILVASCLREIFGNPAIHFNEAFPPKDTQDFLFVNERPYGAPPTPDLPRAPRNVIVVVLESVATQHMHLYGSRYKTTPRLEAEAPNCLVFDNVYSHFTNTANALAAMLLSVYPPMTWRELTVEHPTMPGDTVPAMLKPLGYRIAFISAGDNAYANQLNFLQNRGFDAIWDCRDAGRERDFSWGVEDRYMVDMILRWIDRDRRKPFFIFSWNQGTHNPYLLPAGQPEIDFFADLGSKPPHADAAGWKLSRYLNAIHETDRQLGRLFDALRQRNLAADTIVIIVGDHGEVFGFPHPNWGHTGKVYQEDVNVPFIIWSPRLFSPGRRVETIAAQLDLSPTILDLLGLSSAPTWQGRSVFDASRPPRAYFYGAMEDLLLSVREENWKYILNVTQGREQLFNLTTDPQEQTNLVPQQSARCRRLRQRLAAWVDYQKRHVR